MFYNAFRKALFQKTLHSPSHSLKYVFVADSYIVAQGEKKKVSNIHENRTVQRILGKAGDEIHNEITSTFLLVPYAKLYSIEMYRRRRLAAVRLLFAPFIRFPTRPEKKLKRVFVFSFVFVGLADVIVLSLQDCNCQSGPSFDFYFFLHLLLIQPHTISGCALVTLKVPITSAGRDGGRGDEWRRRQAADSLRRPYLLQASFLIRLKVPCTSGAAGGRAGWCLCHCAHDSRFVLSL